LANILLPDFIIDEDIEEEWQCVESKVAVVEWAGSECDVSDGVAHEGSKDSLED